jgi:tripartite-type tricarboxylate transporter receptor subunit TctC
MKIKRILSLGIAVALATTSVVVLSAPAKASKKWKPNGPITLVVPYGAGGSTDIIGRLLAKKMESELGVPVVVENVPGGNGAVGAQRVYNAKPDGQTIIMLSGSIQTIIPLTTAIGFDPLKMKYIGSTHESVAARFVSKKSGFKTIEDVIAAGKERVLIDVTSGGFGLPDLGTALLSKRVGGLKYRPLATSGGAESVLRLLSGDADMGQNSASTTVAHVKTGDLIPVLIESESWPLLEEMGIPKSTDRYRYSISNPSAVVGPPGLPAKIRLALQRTIEAALDDPEVKANMEKTQEFIRFKTGTQARAIAVKAQNTYAPVLRSVGRALQKP